jgi:ribonuclease BN (tRNA processing enzyme)
MELIILGSGTGTGSLKRCGPSSFLQIGKTKMLVDCGLGALHQLERAGESYKDIDIVFLTHVHNDHICELSSLIWTLKYTPGFKRKKDLLIIGAAGFKKYYSDVIEKMSGKPNTFKIIIKEINKRMVFDDFVVESTPVIHSRYSVAFKFIHDNKSLVVSGDTDFDRRLIALSRNADLLLLECSFPNKQKCIFHMTPNGCGKIARKANVRKMVINHLYPAFPDNRLDDTKKIFNNVILAKDLMRIKI